MARKIAIIVNDIDNNFQNVKHNVDMLMTTSGITEITVYTKTPQPEFDRNEQTSCMCVNEIIPTECDNEPKIRNWVNAKNSEFNGFVHVLSDTVRIVSQPDKFICDIENMMTVLDYPLWLSTVTDNCNFVYSKYNPRIKIQCDMPECAVLNLTDGLNFTSHSNTQWMIYDMSVLRDSNLLKFNENFTIPMFFIIELLARRRNEKTQDQLFFMNQYLTVSSEYGVIENWNQMKRPDIDNAIMQREDLIFKSLNVNFTPDNNIDFILEKTLEKITEKSKKSV